MKPDPGRSDRRMGQPAPSGQDGKQAEPAPLRNTLYRKVTKGKRRLTRGRVFVYRVAVAVAWWTVRALWASCRVVHVAGREGAAQTVRESKSVIPVYWHQHMLYGVHALLDLRREGLKLGFLISPSIDGTAPALLVQKIGGHVIRGSSTHTGARALRDYYETIVKQQVSPAITPDGPKGPLHEFKPGAIVLSQITGKPILPVAVAASRCYRFRTWDKFELPLPFSRVAVVYGEPIKVGRAVDADALAGWQRQMAQKLLDLRAQAQAALERR
jgi:lysophospholipid acyltransferase (LPLAT)-like uncharacterized protein